MCSMSAHLLSVTAREVDEAAIGRQMVQRYAEFSRRALRFRDDFPDVPVVDVLFDDLVEKPVDTACRALGALGLPCSPADRAAMEDLMQSQFKRNKHGRHRYNLTDFALTADGIREAFQGEVQLMSDLRRAASAGTA